MLSEARDRLEHICLYIRHLVDLKQITMKRFVALNEKPVLKKLSGMYK